MAGRSTPEPSLRTILADNASPMTLDGTRAYVVGAARVVIIDPGPSSKPHMDALLDAVAGATVEAIVITHAHPDHDAAAEPLAARVHAPVRGKARGTLRDGDAITTDAGDLIALDTPGHTQDHVALSWPVQGAVFVGDLMMGGQTTSLVAPPEGDLTDYLESLARIRSLEPRTLLPSHGPPFDDPDAAIDAYVRHRKERETRILDALRAGPRSSEDLLDAVYGSTVDPALADAARAALQAYLRHLVRSGLIAARGDAWVRA